MFVLSSKPPPSSNSLCFNGFLRRPLPQHDMHAFGLIVVLAAQASLSLAGPLCKRAVDYYNVTAGGGSMLDNAGSGGGEPLNVIVSGLSSPDVLTDDGILNYARAIGL